MHPTCSKMIQSGATELTVTPHLPTFRESPFAQACTADLAATAALSEEYAGSASQRPGASGRLHEYVDRSRP